MNCDLVREALIDVVRGEAAGAVVDEVLAHTRHCGECAEALDRERSLRASFQALRSASPHSASPRLEAALLAALPGPRPTRRWTYAAAAIGLAATLTLGAWFTLRPRPAAVDQPAPPVAQIMPPPVAPVITHAQAVTAGMAPARKPAVRRAKRLPPDSALATAAATTVAEFVPLPYGDAFGPPERAQVMRVTMPRAALTGLGLPLRYDRPDELIRADILFGEDSIARAIRLVDRNQTSRPTARRANYER